MDKGFGREKVEDSLQMKIQEVAKTVYFKTFTLSTIGTLIVLFL